jgi:hypothetical protein
MMSPKHLRTASRRHFLQFLAASPLLAPAGAAALAEELRSRPADPIAWAPRDLDTLITDPK